MIGTMTLAMILAFVSNSGCTSPVDIIISGIATRNPGSIAVAMLSTVCVVAETGILFSEDSPSGAIVTSVIPVDSIVVMAHDALSIVSVPVIKS
jgi:hypothetical protein